MNQSKSLNNNIFKEVQEELEKQQTQINEFLNTIEVLIKKKSA